MAPAKRTEQEIKAMRDRILDATLELLQQEGLDGVSIRKIADRVGVSHMLLYSYFENRAEIIQSLRKRGFQQMEAFLTESLRRAKTGDALTQMRASLELFIRLSREHPMLYQLTWRRSPEALPLRVDSRIVAQLLEHLSQLIQLCIEREQCVERDPSLAAVTVFSMVNGTFILYHNLPTVAQTERTHLELEIIEAAMTYLTK